MIYLLLDIQLQLQRDICSNIVFGCFLDNHRYVMTLNHIKYDLRISSAAAVVLAKYSSRIQVLATSCRRASSITA